MACAAIARRMMVSAEKQKKLNSEAGKEAFARKKGFHAFSPEEKAIHSRKGALAHIGMTWWNDGSTENLIHTPPDGWIKGRLVIGTGMAKGTILGTFWNKDGFNQRSVECPGDGWVPGKYLTAQQRERRSEIAQETLKRRWTKCAS